MVLFCKTLLFASALLLSYYHIFGFVPSVKKHLRTTLPSSSTALDASALIIQNKGGGHGELGFQLAKVLQSAPYNEIIDSITLLQDDACKDDQEPFASYTKELEGVEVVYAPLGKDTVTLYSLELLLGYKSFDYVFDNNSKQPEGPAKACADIAAQQWNTTLYVYVSSAGMYQPTTLDMMPMTEEGTPIKESAGQAQFDKYCVGVGLPLVSFRPQYIYGDKANKYDYLDYFYDRLVRQLPVPIPHDGSQLVSLTHAEDVASLLAAPILDPQAAVAQRYFNCGTERLHSYSQVVELCAQAAGIAEHSIVNFDADALGKGAFPFRPTNFYVTPDTAKKVLKGWKGTQHALPEDLKAYYENYLARGKALEQKSWEKDRAIIEGSGGDASVYDKHDAAVIE